MPDKTLIVSTLLVALAIGAPTAHATAVAVAYTPTEGRACKTNSRDEETGDATRTCPGVAGYSVLIIESDDRASISLVKADKSTVPLNFWDVVTPTFSTLGPKVEWRLASKDGKPHSVAIIVRVNTVVQADVTSPKPKALLVVARIHNETGCVTAKIPANQPNAIALARSLADSAEWTCLPPLAAGATH